MGSTWGKRGNVVNSIYDSINGYCGFGNNVAPSDLEILVITNGKIKTQSLNDFLTKNELEELKKNLIEYNESDFSKEFLDQHWYNTKF